MERACSRVTWRLRVCESSVGREAMDWASSRMASRRSSAGGSELAAMCGKDDGWETARAVEERQTRRSQVCRGMPGEGGRGSWWGGSWSGSWVGGSPSGTSEEGDSDAASGTAGREASGHSGAWLRFKARRHMFSYIAIIFGT